MRGQCVKVCQRYQLQQKSPSLDRKSPSWNSCCWTRLYIKYFTLSFEFYRSSPSLMKKFCMRISWCHEILSVIPCLLVQIWELIHMQHHDAMCEQRQIGYNEFIQCSNFEVLKSYWNGYVKPICIKLTHNLGEMTGDTDHYGDIRCDVIYHTAKIMCVVIWLEQTQKYDTKHNCFIQAIWSNTAYFVNNSAIVNMIQPWKKTRELPCQWNTYSDLIRSYLEALFEMTVVL